MHGSSDTRRTAAMPAIKRVAFTLLAAALLAIGPLASAAELHGKVVGVADGDTLTVLDDAKAMHRIRLDGIDAPEKGQPYGMRAKEQLSAIVFGKPVVVNWNKHDRYGRIVGQVHLATAPRCTTPSCVPPEDVGLALVEAGLAWHYKRYQNEQTVAERGRYARAEDEARAKRAGLWQDPHPVPPWEYRGTRRSDAAPPAHIM